MSTFTFEDLTNEIPDEDIRLILGPEATPEEIEKYRRELEAEAKI